MAAEWAPAYDVLESLGELGVACAMSIGTRRILFQTIRAMGATRVLDIGTYVGTSALNFALAVGEAGSVVSVDIEPDHWLKVGRRWSPAELMQQAGVADRVEFVTMDARDYLRTTAERFDFISIDGWHEDFAVEEEVELALGRLNPGGLIFLDDVQDEGETPPPGLDVIDGPRMALARLLQRFPIRAVHMRSTLEGEWSATAFLLAKA